MPGEGELPASDFKFRTVPMAGSCLAWRECGGPVFAAIKDASKDPKRRRHLPSLPAEVPASNPPLPPPQEPSTHRRVRTLAVKLC